ncbi:MAG: alpha/beta hydrolase-fold protein [Myxococcota bacterium]
MRGRIDRLTLESECLKGNALGDPSAREVLVYSPAEPAGSLPTIVMLPGYGSTHQSVLNFRPFEPNAIERWDAQIQAGTAKPARIVLPDAYNKYGGSQYLDSAATGAYQSYLVDEVLPFVESKYPCRAEPAGRGVIGSSSGGFGALRLAIDRPGIFGAVGSHAGDAHFEVSMRPILTSAAIAIDRAGGLAPFIERVLQKGPKTAQDFDGIFVVAASAAYAPTLQRTDTKSRVAGNLAEEHDVPNFELPMDPETGALRAEGWARWLEHDPVVKLDRILQGDAPQGLGNTLKLVYLDAGDHDEHGLNFAARMLEERFTNLGIPVERSEFDGGHRHTSWRYAISLPRLAEALST